MSQLVTDRVTDKLQELLELLFATKKLFCLTVMTMSTVTTKDVRKYIYHK